MAEDDFHKQHTLSGLPEGNGPASPPPEIPKFIGPYKIESLLEKGGMSLIYLGTHPDTKEPTTIKILLEKFLSQPDVMQRFLIEAEIIAMADHPNIVKLYGHGEWEGGHYIAMEFIQGISLRQYILQTPMSLKRALEIIIDVAYALCHLHTHGVIHRDLKPENILVTETGSIKVIDFGIAQLIPDKRSQDSSGMQRMIGTPIYMSPEQRRNPEEVSYPSDIYSLGIIAYELVLGKLSHGQIHLSLMPKGLQKILNKSLQPKPEDRYQDIVDFIADVTAYLNSANLQKEKKVGDQLSEFSESLRQSDTILAPNRAPEWPDIEIGIAMHRGHGISGGYHDFLEISDGSYGIIMGESSAKGAEGVIYTATTRGMLRTLGSLPARPDQLMNHLNTILVKDIMDQIFTIGYLVLSPQNNQLHFISCEYGNLWIIPAGSDTPLKIPSKNLALGVDSDLEFAQISRPWHPGDVLIFHNFQTEATGQKDHEITEAYFSQLILENNYPAQRQADNILRKIKITATKTMQERSITIMSIFRK